MGYSNVKFPMEMKKSTKVAIVKLLSWLCAKKCDAALRAKPTPGLRPAVSLTILARALSRSRQIDGEVW